MISICVPVTLVISYSLIIPPACHLFNRKQINCLFLYIGKALMLRAAMNWKELGTLNVIARLLLNITAAPPEPAQDHIPQCCHNPEINPANPGGNTGHKQTLAEETRVCRERSLLQPQGSVPAHSLLLSCTAWHKITFFGFCFNGFPASWGLHILLTKWTMSSIKSSWFSPPLYF